MGSAGRVGSTGRFGGVGTGTGTNGTCGCPFDVAGGVATGSDGAAGGGVCGAEVFTRGGGAWDGCGGDGDAPGAVAFSEFPRP